MIKTDILFTGFYGQSNTGDDAFVEVTSWGAKKYWNKNNTRFLAKHNNLPVTLTPSKGYPFNFPRSYALQKDILVKNTNYLISSGGSTIHSKLNSNNIKHIALDLKDKGKNIKVGAIGVSIGPFKTIEDEKAVQKYLQAIDFIAVRDQRSYDYVKSLNTDYNPVYAFDLAALMPEIYDYIPKTSKKEKKVIGVSVCPVESVHKGGDINNENRRNSNLIELLKEIDKNENIEFKFFIINGNQNNGDEFLTNEIIDKVKAKKKSVVNYSRNTANIWKEINNCDAIISTRLHGAIFACFGQTPFMLVEYHQKCTDFLDDIGYDSKGRINDADFDIKEKARQLLDWCYSDSYILPTKLEEKVEQARLNFTKINIK